MSTFERMDLAQFDGHTPGPWMVRFNGTIERRTVVKRLDGGVTRILASCGPIDAELIAAAPNLLAALSAAYAEIDLLTEECAHWEDKARNWLASPEAARRLEGYRELAGKLAAKDAEIDRLRANALNWVTVTEDPATLPPIDTWVIVSGYRNGSLWVGSRHDSPTAMAMWNESAPITPGDRWAYIPEPK